MSGTIVGEMMNEGEPMQHQPDVTHNVGAHESDALGMFRASVARAPESTAVWYFDGSLSFGDVDRLSDAFAVALESVGFRAGDRLALYLQNVPQFPIGLLAAWKLGGSCVLINPMNTTRELTYILNDSGARVVLCHEYLAANVATVAVVLGDLSVITTSGLAFQTTNDPVIDTDGRPGNLDFLTLCARHAGQPVAERTPQGSDLAFITYTSGTTGEPKGAMNSHMNVAASTRCYRDWMHLGADDVILGIAPVFHITGIIAHLTLGFLLGAPVVLSYRFDPRVVLDALRARQPTFATGVVTALNALIEHPSATKDDFSSLRVVYSGGAPIAPALAERFMTATGVQLHSIYGLTETTSPAHAMPLGAAARVDQTSGAMSIGVPVYHTQSWIEGSDGSVLEAGEIGEIVIRGPQVVAGYWNKPEQTSLSIPNGELHTGDVGFMDTDGWFYIVDRMKDMINASGYKVWPREVEDVLCAHPLVHEAAVVGVPDEYRGETVWAFIRGRANTVLEEDALREHCREHLAAYKRPRRLIGVDSLPMTASGKILRRELRTVAEEMLAREAAETPIDAVPESALDAVTNAPVVIDAADE